MIRVEGVHLTRDGTAVLEDVSLHVAKGEMVCLFGPSGCGKTTILETIAHLLKPDRGVVTTQSQRVAFVFQDDRLLPWRTARQNILFGLSGHITGDDAPRAADRWLERTGLSRVGDRLPAALSGGMKRRLNLARALALDPDILLLDEPFAFLDERAVAYMQTFIRDLHRERDTTLLLVSHVMDHVKPLEPRIVRVEGPPVTLDA